MKRVNKCYVCKQSKEPQISLHIFPNNKIIRTQWLRAFRLKEVDIFPNTRICSRHFEPECFSLNMTIGGKYSLKKGSIPTLLLKEKRKYVKSEPQDLIQDVYPSRSSFQQVIPTEIPSFDSETHQCVPNDLAIETFNTCQRREKDFNNPYRAEKRYDNVFKRLSTFKNEYKQSQLENEVLAEKVKSLVELLVYLKNKNLLDESLSSRNIGNEKFLMIHYPKSDFQIPQVIKHEKTIDSLS